MQHFLKIGGKRYGEVRNFKKVRKFASSNLKFRSSKFKFTEILICNPGGFGGFGGVGLGGFGGVGLGGFGSYGGLGGFSSMPVTSGFGMPSYGGPAKDTSE